MIRTFLALALPDPLLDLLSLAQHRLEIDQPVPRENLHVTVLFLGEQPVPVLEDLHAALETRTLPAADIRLTGLGVFGGDRPRSLHATLAADPGLAALHTRVLAAARDAGITAERRRFVPHVTLARFRPGETSAAMLARSLARHGPLVSDAHRVTEITLMRSHLGRAGASYDALASYPLV